MGLPVGKLIVATNENDILHRFFTKGEYHRLPIEETISPSMDICVSSNFERYLYFLAGNDTTVLSKWMNEFESSKKLTVSGEALEKAQGDFLSAKANTDMTLATIKDYNEKYNYMLCPHSAVGVSAIQQLKEVNKATVCLATAHEAKFPAAVQRAVPTLPTPPMQLSKLASLKTRRSECPNDLKTVQAFMVECIEKRMKGEKSVITLQRAVSIAAIVGIVSVFAQLVLKKK